MSLSTCGRFFRPCLSRIRPAISSSRLNGCRLFSSLEKRPNFAICRLQAARHASDGGQASNFMSDNGLLVLGFGLLGGSVIYGYFSGILRVYPESTASKAVVETSAVSSETSEQVQSPSEAAPSSEKEESQTAEVDAAVSQEEDAPPPLPEVPEHATYILVGAGTASFAAYRAIRKADNNAKVLIIGEEEYPPYMRPPLSKELWYCEDDELVSQLKFKQWNGKERGIFFEPEAFFCKPGELPSKEEGGVALLKGKKVVGINSKEQKVKLDDGAEIRYDKLLLAPGGIPRNLPIFENSGDEVKKRITLFRKIVDFKDLDDAIKEAKSVAVVGGGFLGSELACALGHRGSKKTGLNVLQIFPYGPRGQQMVKGFLSDFPYIFIEGVSVIPNSTVEHVSFKDNQVNLRLNSGEELQADRVIVAVGLEPNVELANVAGLEVDPILGGFHVNSELQAKSNIWVAGDAACFYDPNLGRRRVEHHDHAVVSGRLAGENMTGAGKPYWHQSMFWSDLGPDVGYEAIGLVDSVLPTVGVWAKATEADTPKAVVEATGEGVRSETEGEGSEPSPVVLTQPAAPVPTASSEEFGKGVVFYMRGKRVVGVVLWNVFNRMPLARKIIKEERDQDDLNELAKLFDIHKS
ncbi:unnamed protein product [Porites lobata]|uniref:Apoptosis-inducing factor 1, mitochondrial n=1 Tax=Porites lobata TaxID=104759 RepID=A0ABN8RBR8_9CNID|nr:unnamed protein product [Porites lobata]